MGLHHADHAPAQRPGELPAAQLLGRDAYARVARVRVQQLLARAEPRRGQVGPREAPGGHAHPAEILDRVAEVRQLPVEHARDALAVDHQVAHPEVPVNERPARRRPVGAQRAEGELEHRMRLAEVVVHRPQLRERLLGRRCERLLGGHPVHRRERPRKVVQQRRRVPGGHDLARVARARERHKQRPRRAEDLILAPVRDHARHRHARCLRGLEQGRLAGRLAGGLAGVFALQDQRAARAGVHGVCLARGATAQPPDLSHRDPVQGLAQPLRDRGGAPGLAPPRRCGLAPLHGGNSLRLRALGAVRAERSGGAV